MQYDRTVRQEYWTLP